MRQFSRPKEVFKMMAQSPYEESKTAVVLHIFGVQVAFVGLDGSARFRAEEHGALALESLSMLGGSGQEFREAGLRLEVIVTKPVASIHRGNPTQTSTYLLSSLRAPLFLRHPQVARGLI